MSKCLGTLHHRVGGLESFICKAKDSQKCSNEVLGHLFPPWELTSLNKGLVRVKGKWAGVLIHKRVGLALTQTDLDPNDNPTHVLAG